MASITAHLRAMGTETPEYQQKQTLSLEAQLSELDQMQLQFSEEQFSYTEEGMLDSIWNGIKAFFKAIADFFKRLFGIGPTKEQNATLDKTEKELVELAEAVRDVEPVKPDQDAEKILKEAGLVVDTPIRLSDIPISSQADLDAFMMSDSDKPLTPAQFDKSLDQSERNKLTRVWLDDLVKGEQQKPARTKEEKAGERVAKRAAQVLPNDATPEQVAKVASKAVAVTDAKMRLLLDEVGRCSLPGIDYEGSKLHIALANYKILHEPISTASDIRRVTDEIAGYIKNKKYTELTERLKYGPLGNGFGGRVEWDKEAGEVVFHHSKKALTFENHIEDVLSSGVLAANSYEKLIADRSFKNLGEMIKSVSESIDSARRGIGIGSKTASVVSDTVAAVEKMDSSDDAAAKDAIKAAGVALRTMGKIAAIKEQSERTSLANALQAVRILRRKAGQIKEYNGLLKKLNEEVAKVKSRK